MKKKSRKQENEENEENFEEEDENENVKKKKKKNKKKKDEVPKKPLIERLEEELNQIEFCNVDDYMPSSTKIRFESINRSYFQTYFIDKLADANTNNVLILRDHNLTDELIGDVLDFESLCENEAFKHEDPNEVMSILEGYLNSIELLDLSFNQLKKIPFRLIRLFPNLKEIKLNGNSISYKNSDMNELTMNEEGSHESDQKLNMFNKIESLNLENNKLDSNITFLSLFKNLIVLNLANNYISNLNLYFIVSQLTKLVDLNISSNIQQINSQALSDSNSNFLDQRSLRRLNLRNMGLTNLIFNLTGFRNIEYLILDDNKLQFIPTEIYDFQKLKLLSLNSNMLTEISAKFCLQACFKQTLTHFNLYNNSLQTENFSEKFYLFKSLLKLDLSSNKLKYVPNTLPESLRELRLNNNRLLTLMIKPVHLLQNTRVSAYEDDLEEIEVIRDRLLNSTTAFAPATKAQQLQYPSVFYLRNLEYLNLSSNQIQEIPNDFGLLNISLKYLNLSSNLIKNLDIKLCCRGLYNLKYLDLSSNFIKYIPEQICEFKKLEHLKLNHNSIQYLNYELCNELSSLVELDLSFNQINELPIFSYRNGKVVSIQLSQALAYNSEDSPYSSLFTFGLKNMKKIDLSSNKIQNMLLFTIVFGNCRSLVDINLSNNQINTIRFEVEADSATTDDGVVVPNTTINAPPPVKPVKHKKVYVLNELQLLNLSNNRIDLSETNVDKKLLIFLLKFFKLAPNLSEFLYDQLNGVKLNNNLGQSSQYDIQEMLNENNFSRVDYESLTNNLKIINLSNNSLSEIPQVLFNMNNLKEIYLNGNSIQKIPSNLLHTVKTVSLIEKEKNASSEEATENKNVAAAASEKTIEIKKIPPIIGKIEKLELDDNDLRIVPENLFTHFKNLKTLKVNNNPLKEPPKDAICASFSQSGDDEHAQKMTNIWNYMSDDFENEILNNLSSEANGDNDEDKEKLATIRSYMVKYKRREGISLIELIFFLYFFLYFYRNALNKHVRHN